MEELGKYTGKLNIIPENSEKCISISQRFTVDHYWNKKWVDIMSMTRELRFIHFFDFFALISRRKK